MSAFGPRSTAGLRSPGSPTAIRAASPNIVVMMILGLVRTYISSYQWVVKGGWHIAECVTRPMTSRACTSARWPPAASALRCFAGSSPSTGIFTRVSVLIPRFVLAKIMITVGLMMMHGRG
jgi:hypothetical protein